MHRDCKNQRSLPIVYWIKLSHRFFNCNIFDFESFIEFILFFNFISRHLIFILSLIVIIFIVVFFLSFFFNWKLFFNIFPHNLISFFLCQIRSSLSSILFFFLLYPFFCWIFFFNFIHNYFGWLGIWHCCFFRFAFYDIIQLHDPCQGLKD